MAGCTLPPVWLVSSAALFPWPEHWSDQGPSGLPQPWERENWGCLMTRTAAHPQCGYSELPGLSHRAGNRSKAPHRACRCQSWRAEAEERRGRHFWSSGGLQQVSALDALGVRSWRASRWRSGEWASCTDLSGCGRARSTLTRDTRLR